MTEEHHLDHTKAEGEEGEEGGEKKEGEGEEAKKREDVGPDGLPCGNCYGSEEDPDQCCNTCEEVKDAYRKKGWAFSPDGIDQCTKEFVLSTVEAVSAMRISPRLLAVLLSHHGTSHSSRTQVGDEGCNLFGDMDLTTVNGNFHFAPGKKMGEVVA